MNDERSPRVEIVGTVVIREIDYRDWHPIFANSYSITTCRAGDRTRTGDVQLGKLAFYQLNYARDATCCVRRAMSTREPQVGIEPTTARLRIECSTPELLWRRLAYALARIRTATPCGTTPSRWRVYQFHHQGLHCQLRFRLVGYRLSANPGTHRLPEAGRKPRNRTPTSAPSMQRSIPNTGPTGLEPATSRVTVECSNQTELRPLMRIGARMAHLPPPIPISYTACHRGLPKPLAVRLSDCPTVRPSDVRPPA